MKVKIKSWERMVEEFGYWGLDDSTIDLKVFNWTKDLEDEIPDDRIIEVSIESHRCRGVKEKPYYYYRDYGISPDAIEEYLTDESGNDLTNPLHPANCELLPELKSEQEFKLKPLAEILEEESCKIANNNLAIFKQIQNKSHLCHYTKFQLDFDINTSIRFIHAFDDRPELVGKFIYKHHEEKLFSVIEPQLAEHFIKTQCSNEAEEFINRYVGQGKKKQYRRIKVTKDSLFRYFEN